MNFNRVISLLNEKNIETIYVKVFFRSLSLSFPYIFNLSAIGFKFQILGCFIAVYLCILLIFSTKSVIGRKFQTSLLLK